MGGAAFVSGLYDGLRGDGSGINGSCSETQGDEVPQDQGDRGERETGKGKRGEGGGERPLGFPGINVVHVRCER